jgi:hypothetical protein
MYSSHLLLGSLTRMQWEVYLNPRNPLFFWSLYPLFRIGEGSILLPVPNYLCIAPVENPGSLPLSLVNLLRG